MQIPRYSMLLSQPDRHEREIQQRQMKEEEIYKRYYRQSELREREKALTERLSKNIPMDLRSRLNKERKKIRQALSKKHNGQFM